MEFFLRILDKLLKVDKYQFKPSCIHLYWTLPEKIKFGKEQKMRSMCGVELKTMPTCGGIFESEPHCPRYEAQQVVSD